MLLRLVFWLLRVVLLVWIVAATRVLPALAQEEVGMNIVVPGIESYENHARWWQYGWLTVYSVGAGVSAYEAGRTRNSADKRLHVINAVVGVSTVRELLVKPIHPTVLVRGNGDSRDDLYRLQQLAEDVREQSSWEERLGGWLTALIGGVVVASGPGRASDGIGFFLSSGAITELRIWTLPRDALRAWHKYQKNQGRDMLIVEDCADGENVLYLKSRSSALMLTGAYPVAHGLALHWRFF